MSTASQAKHQPSILSAEPSGRDGEMRRRGIAVPQVEWYPEMGERNRLYRQGQTGFLVFTLASSLIFTFGFPQAHHIPVAWYWSLALSLGVTVIFGSMPRMARPRKWRWGRLLVPDCPMIDLKRPMIPGRLTLLVRGLIIFVTFTLHAHLLAELCSTSEANARISMSLYPAAMLYTSLLVLFDHVLLDVLRLRDDDAKSSIRRVRPKPSERS